jgi:hypothetical protein
MQEAGVDRAILIPPSWECDSSDFSLEAAAKYPGKFAVMGRIPINKPEGPRDDRDLEDQPGMLGVRLTFHHAWDQDWIKNGHRGLVLAGGGAAQYPSYDECAHRAAGSRGAWRSVIRSCGSSSTTWGACAACGMTR